MSTPRHAPLTVCLVMMLGSLAAAPGPGVAPATRHAAACQPGDGAPRTAWPPEVPRTRRQADAPPPRGDHVMTAQPREAQPPMGSGVLVGSVSVHPSSPIDVPGTVHGLRPVPSVRVVIRGMDGRQIQSAITDAHGHYRVHLPPGTYRLDMPALPAGTFTKDLPTMITITEGQETRLAIHLDTGIR